MDRRVPWAAAKPDDKLYEYACHEGNYAMEGIMKGARLLDAEAAEAAKQAGDGSSEIYNWKFTIVNFKVSLGSV